MRLTASSTEVYDKEQSRGSTPSLTLAPFSEEGPRLASIYQVDAV